MSRNHYDTQPTALDVDGISDKELLEQKAYKSQRLTAKKRNNDNDDDCNYSKAQQANQITLQQIKDESQKPHAAPRKRRAKTTTAMTTSSSGVNKKSHQAVDFNVSAGAGVGVCRDKNNDVKVEQDEDDEVLENENEHLLAGQEQQKQQQQQQHRANTAFPTISQARANFLALKATTNKTRGQDVYTPYWENYPLKAGNPNKYPAVVNPLGSNQGPIASATNADDFTSPANRVDGVGGASATEEGKENVDLKAHCELELQKFPKEMTQSENSINEQNGSTIILSPTLLPPTATTQAMDAQNRLTNGGSGSGAGHNNGSVGEGNVVARVECRNAAAVNGTTTVGCCDNGVYQGPKVWQYLVKHYPITSQPLAILVIFLALWALGYVLMPDYAVPHTGIMRIAFLFVGAQISGILVTFFKLPDMLGMLFFGVFYTNVGLADFSGYQKFESFLRDMALINIMLLAGLGLDANAFKKLWLMILRLTLVPTIAEVTIIMLLAHFLLHMPWLWGILLGLVITAVSPNVVVTVMLKLKEERLGLNSGIHTLIYAMTTCNDVVAIFLFGVISGVIFSKGSLTEQLLQGPVGIGIGIVFGSVYGFMLTVIPSRNSAYVNGLRFVLTILGGTIAVLGSKAIGYPSAGALGCVTVAFIAGIGWKRQMQKLTPQQLQAYENANVGKRLDLLWKFLKPVSFSLIGKEINFAVLDGKVVGYGVLIIVLGSVFRLAFAYLSTYGGNLTKKERGYITISGFPKATVQAALGPIALDYARSLNADDGLLSLASNVLIISVLAIILTAPLGAIFMLRLAPVWLQYTPPTQTTTNNDNPVNGNRCRGNMAANLHMAESAVNINLDHNQKSIRDQF